MFYSADGGNSWLPIEVDATSSQFSFDAQDVDASQRGMFRVIATDGFNTTTAEVGPVTVRGAGISLIWGDWNCDQVINGVDALFELFFAAHQMAPTVPNCPAVGDAVQPIGLTPKV